jgi:hypothetical protein
MQSARKRQGRWLSVATAVLPGPARIALEMTRRPGQTATRLALDPNFNGHWAFFLTGLGIYLTTFQLILPKVLARFHFEVQAPSDHAGLLTAKILSLVLVFVVAPVFYWLCRLLSRESRSLIAYLRLLMLSFGYWYFLAVALFVLWFVLCLGVSAAAILIEPANPAAIAFPIEKTLYAVLYIGSVVFTSATLTRAFWALAWLTSIAVALFYLLTSHFVLFPILQQAAGYLHELLIGVGI